MIKANVYSQENGKPKHNKASFAIEQIPTPEDRYVTCLMFAFIAYYVCRFFGVIMPVMGLSLPFDMSNLIAVLSLVVVMLFLKYRIKESLSNSGSRLSILLILIIFIAVMLSLTYIKSYPTRIIGSQLTSPITRWIRYFGATFIPGLLLFVIGLDSNNLQHKLKKFRIAWNILFAVYTLSVFYISLRNGAGIMGTAFQGGSDNIYYLPYSDAYLIVFATFRVTNRSSKSLWLYDLVALITVFKIGSRTSLLCLIFLLIVSFLIKQYSMSGGVRAWHILTLTILIGLASVLVMTGFSGISITIKNPENQLQQSYNRMVKIFSTNGYEDDASVQGRAEIDQQNMQDLKKFWITGRFLHEVETGNGYTHNIKSWWVEYGVIPFSMLIAILAIGFFNVWRSLSFGQYIINQLSIDLFLVYILSTLFSRTYSYPTSWLLIGTCVAFGRSASQGSTGGHNWNDGLENPRRK